VYGVYKNGIEYYIDNNYTTYASKYIFVSNSSMQTINLGTISIVEITKRVLRLNSIELEDSYIDGWIRKELEKT